MQRHQQAAVIEEVDRCEDLQIASHDVVQVVVSLADVLVEPARCVAFQASRQDVEPGRATQWGDARRSLYVRAPSAMNARQHNLAVVALQAVCGVSEKVCRDQSACGPPDVRVHKLNNFGPARTTSLLASKRGERAAHARR